MIISIASGKGGTGKTTVSTNLAAVLKEQATFVDCDVEEPNGHIFLHPHIDSSETVYTLVPEVIEDLCNGCRNCVDICRFNALTVVGDRVLTFPELCHSCGGCLQICPQKALKNGKRELGKIESGKADAIAFHRGLLRIGEAMSPPLIKHLRKKTVETEVTLIDAPPGTSCPVIAAIHGVDFVLLVTEPTPFGLHDLRLAHETVRELGLPCGLVINRADLGDGKVEKYAKEHQIPVLLSIPFEKEIAELYSQGKLLVETIPEWHSRFSGLYEAIKTQVEKEEQ